jgi:VanZ family protein
MMKFMQPKKIILLWMPVLLWMGLIFYLSGKPGLKIVEGPLDFWTRKPAHVMEYAVLFLLFLRAVRGSFSWGVRKVYAVAGVLSFLFAITDEFHQLHVPLREGKIFDLGFDLLGILLGILFLHFKRKKS